MAARIIGTVARLPRSKQKRALARSYEFADAAEHFLLDAERTKDAKSRQPSGELVHLPSSLASREAGYLLKHDSDRGCETTRPVPGDRLRS